MTTPHLSIQTSATYEEALQRAAALWGIEEGYWDIWGQYHHTSSDARRAILASMGVSGTTREELDCAVEQRYWEQWSRLTPATSVVHQGAGPRELAIYIPSSLEDHEVALKLRWEQGGEHEHRIRIGQLTRSGTAVLREKSLEQRRVPLPMDLPLGYHHLECSVYSPGGERILGSAGRLISCPAKAYLPPGLDAGGKAAGLAVSLFGVHSQRSWGCGDYTDLRSIIDWVADELGGQFVGLNPLHAIHNRQPYDTSPYLPNCVFYKNLIYLDVEAVDGFEGLPRRLFRLPRMQEERKSLNASEFVPYEGVQQLKLRFLRLAFRNFLRECRSGSERGREFQKYIDTEGRLLHLFATYSALDEWIHSRRPDAWIWRDWPPEYQDPDSEAVRRFADEHWRAVLFQKYLQWQGDRQLGETQEYARRKGLTVGLYHDLALATARFGSDVWAHRRFFVSGCRVGAPPDDFSPQGQDWSFPPPNAVTHQQDGYRLFADSIRRICQHGGALRIDHVMRFFRLYWIPEGVDATQGAYVRDHHQDLLGILALESVRRQVLIVGEDLGTVEPRVRELLAHSGILSYRLFYFERDQNREFRLPQEYPRQALVSSTTHDLPTLAGFWLGRDIEARRSAGILPDEGSYQAALAERGREKQKMIDALFRSGLLPENFPRSAADVPELVGDLHNAIVGFLASTSSLLFLLNQEDLTKEIEQQNLPGTTSEHPNWCRRMKYSVEELRSSDFVRAVTGMFRQWIEKTGRLG